MGQDLVVIIYRYTIYDRYDHIWAYMEMPIYGQKRMGQDLVVTSKIGTDRPTDRQTDKGFSRPTLWGLAKRMGQDLVVTSHAHIWAK